MLAAPFFPFRTRSPLPSLSLECGNSEIWSLVASTWKWKSKQGDNTWQYCLSLKPGANWRWSNSVGWSLLRNEMPSGEIILKTIEISIDSNSTCKKYQELSRSIRSCGFHACEVSHRRYLLELAPCPAEVSCGRLSWTWKAQIETNRSAFRAFTQVKCACIILYHLVSFSFVQMPFRFAGREREREKCNNAKSI